MHRTVPKGLTSIIEKLRKDEIAFFPIKEVRLKKEERSFLADLASKHRLKAEQIQEITLHGLTRTSKSQFASRLEFCDKKSTFSIFVVTNAQGWDSSLKWADEIRSEFVELEQKLRGL